jgi:hypothetical protein
MIWFQYHGIISIITAGVNNIFETITVEIAKLEVS